MNFVVHHIVSILNVAILSLSLKKFTGHASPVTHLQFIPSNLSHDSNANHIPNNGISGQYFISGAEQDRLMNIW